VVTRKQQKERTRQRLLDAARSLFAQQGITATRTLDVARAAGVAHGTVFTHFPTREELVEVVVGEFAAAVAMRIHTIVDQGAGLREVLVAHLDGLGEDEALYARMVMEGPLLPRPARVTLTGIQSVISFHLFAAAERELADGRIRPMAQHLLFNTWLGLVHHYVCNRDQFAPGGSVLDRCGPELIDHYLGLLAP
jgi:AcrR family transcriptional regulator